MLACCSVMSDGDGNIEMRAVCVDMRLKRAAMIPKEHCPPCFSV